MQIKGIKGWRDPHVRALPTPPPTTEYDDWLNSRNRAQHSGYMMKKMSGAQLRRAVVMRKQGETWKSCGEAIGYSGKAVKQWLDFLPLHLAP